MAKYIIGSRKNSTDDYSISSKPKIHTDKFVAQTEAQRLAGTSPREYVVFEMISAYKSQQVSKVDI
jgi:hypothetical protein